MPFGPLTCQHCGKDYMVNVSRRLTTSRFCSPICRARGIVTPEINAKKANRGSKHPRFVPIGTRREWKGIPGIWVKTEDGWEREHRVVADAPSRSQREQYLIVHHLDGDPTNNDPDNLETMTQAEHAKLHDPERVRDSKGRYT